MKPHIYKALLALPALALLATACEENDYKVYDTTQKDSVFFEYYNAKAERDSSYSYNFGYDIRHTHTLEIPVTLMGMPKDYDRTVSVEAVEGMSGMVPGVHYNITEARIPAGQSTGKVAIELLRDNDPALLTSPVSMRIVIAENGDLRPVQGTRFDVTYSDVRQDERPEWWLQERSYGAWPIYSFEVAQLFFDYFYRIVPRVSPDIFKQMIDGYGDYFVNAVKTQGPWTMYESFIRNYVFIPMADEHPEIEWTADPHW